VAASFVAAGLVDEIWLLRSPQGVGAGGVDALDRLPLTTITGSKGFVAVSSEALEKDTLTIYQRSQARAA